MRAWVLGEGPTLEPQNVETIGYAIHAHIEARDYKAASKAWDDDYFWSTGVASEGCQSGHCGRQSTAGAAAPLWRPPSPCRAAGGDNKQQDPLWGL